MGLQRWVVGMASGLLMWGVAGLSTVAALERDPLIQLLIKKGVITEQELAQVETDLAAGQAKVADTSVIHVGQGTLKVGGLFQGWALWDGNDNDRFRIRRTELKFAGDVLGDERFKYTVMIDPVQVQEDNTRRTVLQDAFFTLDKIDWLPHHKIDLGQYKLPLTEEGLRSSAKLDFAERSFIGRTFGDQRDVGAMLTGEWPALTYQAGVFNGSGQNQSDANDGKDLAGRVVLRPLKAWELVGEAPELGQLEVGMAGYYRHDRGTTREKKRLAYEVRYDYKRLSLKSEYAFGQGTAGSNATTEN
ncbi:MAG: hypothetical protein HY353_02085, partial [Candidatus Omnitrophica bacterium]|nr:hypothetical protein [Candidatus Omnitrophota bacterium]